MGTTKGKTFGVASLHTGQLTLLVKQTVCIVDSYSSIKPGGLLPTLSEHQRSKLDIQDIQLQKCDSWRHQEAPGEPRSAPILGHMFGHVLKLSPYSPL
jgi:hypothetical protein